MSPAWSWEYFRWLYNWTHVKTHTSGGLIVISTPLLSLLTCRECSFFFLEYITFSLQKIPSRIIAILIPPLYVFSLVAFWFSSPPNALESSGVKKQEDSSNDGTRSVSTRRLQSHFILIAAGDYCRRHMADLPFLTPKLLKTNPNDTLCN